MAIPPDEDPLQLADGTIADEFAHAGKVRIGVALRTRLGGDFAALVKIGRAQEAALGHAHADRLFAIDVETAVHRPHRDVRMRMIRGADDDGLEIFLLQTFPPIDVGLGAGEFLQRFRETRLVHITKRDHILLGKPIIMSKPPTPYADQRDIEPFAWSILAK